MPPKAKRNEGMSSPMQYGLCGDFIWPTIIIEIIHCIMLIQQDIHAIYQLNQPFNSYANKIDFIRKNEKYKFLRYLCEENKFVEGKMGNINISKATYL